MMKRYWARRRDGKRIDVRTELNRQERQFALDSSGEIDSRYALEWVIEQLSRSENARLEYQELTSVGAGSTP